MNISVESRELERIKQGDRHILKELYKRHRPHFIKWAQWKYAGSYDLADVYQEAFTIFFFNVTRGKFTGLNSSIQTYLFGIGKNLLNKKFQHKDQTHQSLDDIPEIALPHHSLDAEHESSHKLQQVKSVLDNVGEPCKKILMHYYYDNFTMEAIAENMGYKNAMVAKKKKCECLMKIRKALQSRRSQLNQEQDGK